MTHRQLLKIFLKHDKSYLRGNGNRTNIIVLANSMGFEKTKEKVSKLSKYISSKIQI